MTLGLRRMWLRRAAIVLLFVSGSSFLHRPQGDDVCLPDGVEAHDESRHVVTADIKAGHGEHCAVCHWMRTLKPAFASRPVWAGSDDRRSPLILTSGLYRQGAALHNLPARAPPLSLS